MTPAGRHFDSLVPGQDLHLARPRCYVRAAVSGKICIRLVRGVTSEALCRAISAPRLRLGKGCIPELRGVTSEPLCRAISASRPRLGKGCIGPGSASSALVQDYMGPPLKLDTYSFHVLSEKESFMPLWTRSASRFLRSRPGFFPPPPEVGHLLISCPK